MPWKVLDKRRNENIISKGRETINKVRKHKLQSHLKEYTSDIISKDVIFYNSKECFFIKTTNYTFQEKEAIEFIKKYLQIFVETFYCGSFNLDFQYQGINNSTTQFDCLSNIWFSSWI